MNAKVLAAQADKIAPDRVDAIKRRLNKQPPVDKSNSQQPQDDVTNNRKNMGF